MIRSILNTNQIANYRFVRCFSAKAVIELNERAAGLTEKKRNNFIPPEYRFQYQEFLPDPRVRYRNTIRERLERKDMLDRRTHIHVPEFYVGSIVAVTSSDPHSQGKTNRFVGICIDRSCNGLRANFILRNVVDHQGMEIQYEIYDPTLQKIEVLRLEKRLDENLFYLRDALPEYSTFDLNMEPEIVQEGAPVPINDIKVKLKPRPWFAKWEQYDLRGIENVEELSTIKQLKKAKKIATPWEKYDLMKEYRRSIPEEEQKDIFSEIFNRMKTINDENKKKLKTRRVITKPSKLG